MTEVKRRRYLVPSSLLLTLIPTLLLPFLLGRTPFSPTFSPITTPAPAQNLTIGIKTYVCDDTAPRLLAALLRSIRVNNPSTRVIIANDGPIALSAHPLVTADPFTEELRLPLDVGISAGRNAMVHAAATPYFMLLDDDHLLDPAASLPLLHHPAFDIVGLRVRNLPGIPELERARVFLPRYVANITRFENRHVELCVWDENVGPGVHGMTEPIKVDVLHNAFVARTSVLRDIGWRHRLKVNEHMTFFLDAWKRGVRVGYLPSAFVHHRPRETSRCYDQKRSREHFFAKFLDYDDEFRWTKECYKRFPEYVKWHLDNQKRLKA